MKSEVKPPMADKLEAPHVEPCAHCGAVAKVKQAPSGRCWTALLIHKDDCIWLDWIGEGTQVILERGFAAWNTRSRASVAAPPPDDHARKLTLPELNHISGLLEARRDEGSYTGPREQYYARTERLIKWCDDQIGEK